MKKIFKYRGVREIFGFIITLLSVEYGILKIHSILFTLRESGCSYEQQDTPISVACVHKRMPKLACRWLLLRSSIRLRPWTPWIWGILDFRSIRVIFRFFERLLQEKFESVFSTIGRQKGSIRSLVSLSGIVKTPRL